MRHAKGTKGYPGPKLGQRQPAKGPEQILQKFVRYGSLDPVQHHGGDTMADPDKKFQVINSALDDQRRLIAAGKVQRWDVVKWGVTVNVALATAATLIQFKGALDVCGLAVPFSFIPSLLAAAVALVSLVLVLYYNYGTTAARTDATYLVKEMKEKHGIDYSGIVGKDLASHYSKGFFYDWPELLLFTAILFGSVLLPLVPALFRTPAN
jgi:hypothetical protein